MSTIHPHGPTGQPTAVASGSLHTMTPTSTPATHRTASRAADITTATLTFTAAIFATSVAGVGMWRFFGDVLHLDNLWLRGTLFAFLEVALFVSAIRARRNLLEDLARLTAEGADTRRASTGVDGAAVWAFAAMSGVFSALDGRTWGERAFRLVAPLVAAWLWERGLAAHRRRARNVRLFRGVDWAGIVERIMVRLRLLRVAERTATEVERARRVARLAALRHRVFRLERRRAWQWRIARATRRFEAAMAKANEEFGFAEDAALRSALQLNLAVLYRAVEGTNPEAVARLAPWGETPSGLPVAPATGDRVAPRVAPATTTATKAGRRATRARNASARKVQHRPATPAMTTPATDRSDAALVAIITPHVAGVTEAPSQRSLQKAIKDATGVGVNLKRLETLVEMARNAPAVAKVNGHDPVEVLQ